MNEVHALPLLIPSFSSKGSPIYLENGHARSENFDILISLEHNLYHSYLISAYDIYYEYMSKDYMMYPLPDILMVDSGGYETNNAFDLCEHFRSRYRVNPWNKDKMLDIYASIYNSESFSGSKLIFSTYDNFDSFDSQLSEINNLANSFPNAQIDFLVHGTPTIADVLPKIQMHIDKMHYVSLIGFTEKELGETIAQKLKTLIQFCAMARNAEWPVAIHVYGGLEPNVLKLFFYAGASVFDGLSWQKYRYSNNSTLFSPGHFFIQETDAFNRYQMMCENIAFLQNMEHQLYEYRQRFGISEPSALLDRLLSMEKLSISDIINTLEGGE